MTEIVEPGSEREGHVTATDGSFQQGAEAAQTPRRLVGPLAAVLGQELQRLERREADLQAEEQLGKRRDVQDRIAELQDGIAAVRPPSKVTTGK